MPEPDPLPSIKTPWDSAAPPSGADAVPPIPVPDHTLIRRIGKGSYGEVWLARNVLGVYRAVKIIDRRAFDDDRPFEREFAGIKRFEPVSRSHESQLNILHVGRGPDCFYYVMELADDMGHGQAITEATYTPRNLRSELLLKGRLPVEECLRLGLALTTALENLHRHGLVHRDIKPSNIVFVNGVPKLADIGLVALAESTMSFVGTEGYLPPEGPGTVQADLFSLGKVLYEISSGHDRQQFPELPTGINELPDRAAHAEFNDVILRACAPDVKQRYASAAEMHADLALLQSGKSVARMRAVERRLKFMARVGVAVTGIALLAGAAFVYQQVQTREARRLAGANQRLATEQARLSNETRERLIRLNVANGIREMDRGDLAPALVWLTEALALATNNPADAPIHRIRVHQLLAQHPRLLSVFPHPANVPTAEFSPDERQVVTACVDGKIRIWDTVQDEKPVAEFQQDGPVGQVRFTRNGQRLFVVELNPLKRPARVALLDAATGKPVFQPITGLTAAMLSPDDRWLAVARTNFVVQVIATDTRQVVAEAAGHEDRVEMVDFSPNSSQLITAGRDRTVRRWNVSTGQPIGSPLRHDQPVLRAVFNRDASQIATATFIDDAGAPIQFQMWDAATGTALGKPIPGIKFSSVLSFNLSGRRLVTGDSAHMVQVWDVDSHFPILPPLNMAGHALSLDFSPDGARIAVGNEAGETRIWDAEIGSLVFPPLHNSSRTESVRFNQDGSRLLTASDDGTVKLWDLAQVPADRSFQILGHERTTAAVSPDGRQLLLGISDVPPALHLVDLETLREMTGPMPFGIGYYPGLLTFDRSGNQWAEGYGPTRYPDWSPQPADKPSTADLWRREGGRVLHFALPHVGGVRGVFFHEDGSQVLTFADDKTTRIWNTLNGSLRQTIRWPEKDAAWVAVSPNLRTAIAIFGDEKGWHMRFHEVLTGKILGQFPEKNPDINAATFSPDGTRAGTVGDNQSGRIWDARSGEPLTPSFKHGGTLTCLEWSPDGRRVLTAGLSPEVKVWDAATGELSLPPLVMKAKPVERARFSADGRFIVARSDEDLVRVWDAATGEAVTSLLPHNETVAAVFVAAAQRLVTVMNSGGVRVWNLTETAVPAEDLSSYARLLAGGSLGRSDSPRWAGSDELAARLRSLRSRQPNLFRASPDRLSEWRRRQAQAPDTLGRMDAAIFHLERLARIAPEDTAIQEQLARCRALRIPARDPATPPQLLDLTRAYTRSFDLLIRRDFAELPRDRQKLGGTEFDVRGLVKLDHHSEQADHAGPFHPMASIRVGQRCRTLHFVQAAEGGLGADGSTVARWTIHYADGSAREWPVIYGEHVRDWWWSPSTEPLEAKQATLVWRGHAPIWNRPGTDGVRLFKATWTNPEPNVEITQLEYRIGETALKPFVVAITAE
jgi:eukaryotic-like serine/threonine-protein kinase